MNKMYLIPLLLALATSVSRASDHPAGPPQITPVSWIVQTRHDIDVDDKYVTMKGEVIKRDDGSDWWFADTTGVVRLDTGDKELPVGKMLVVSGHIDQARFGIGYLEVEVRKWHYADDRG